MKPRPARSRRLIAYLGYCDVFEDFYPHYGVSQQDFATKWAATGSHAFVQVLQRAVGDVTWYELSLNPELDCGTHEVSGCRVRFLRSSLPHRLLWKLYYGPRWAWRHWRFYTIYATIASYLGLFSRELFRALVQDQPDALLVQDYSNGRFDVAWLIARKLRIPLLARHSGSRISDHLARPIRRLTLPRATRLIVSSQREKMLLSEHYHVPTERMDVILTPIDTQTYRPMDRAACLRQTGLPTGKRYLLFVGRLQDAVKRVSVILRTFAALLSNFPDLHLAVVGTGPDHARLERLAAELTPGQVTFLGWIGEPGRKAMYYNAAEALLLPSTQEGFPTVIGEALCCGTPVIASDIGGCGELVRDGETGWLIPPGSEEHLRAAVMRLLKDPDASKMRHRAREAAVERVDPGAVGAALAECFRKAWSENGA